MSALHLFIWFGIIGLLLPARGAPFEVETADPACAQLLTNVQARWLNMPERLPSGKSLGYIRTNSVAFQRYALETAVNEMTRIARALRFPISSNVACSDITYFQVVPSYYGLDCAVVLQKRYSLNIRRNYVSNFSDSDFFLAALENRPERLRELLKQPNLLDKRSAEKLARQALKALGFQNGRNVLLREPPSVEQEPGGLPYYKVQWKDQTFTGPSEALHGTSVSFEICGVSSNVSHFFIVDLPSNQNALRLPYATNFFQLLGMSETNKLWEAKWKTRNE